ncbi:MAG: pyruvate kinase [Burkholderiales bacterium]|nr:pyruvate kinase [Burkholderiales bacterium]
MKVKSTKIIATIGPSSSTMEMVEQLILAGVNVFRLNFSHGSHEIHAQNIINIRETAHKLSKPIAIMADLQGPKIRVGKFKDNQAQLLNGDTIIFDTDFSQLGTKDLVGVDYKNLAKDVKDANILLLDDGKITLKVVKVNGSEIHCRVEQGGILKNNKGINKLGGGLTAPALTYKDLDDIKFISTHNVDYVAVSFPKDVLDIQYARQKLLESGSCARIIAKMERTEAVFDNMEELVKASDGVMVARGDLAVEVGEALVPGLQKKLIKTCTKYHKISIVATQMLESMIESPVATRAEVSDIANAVLDGADAVMLSAETASGKYPLQAVETMSRVCEEAEKMLDSKLEANFGVEKFADIQQTISMAALFSAYHMEADAIVALTTSGATALWMSRIISGVPVYAVTDSIKAFQTMAMYRGVFPILLKHKSMDINSLVNEACNFLKYQHIINAGQTVVVTFGDLLAQIGSTNSLRVIKI